MKQVILPEPAKCVKKEKNMAVFEIKPCSPGYGVTLGNALRRVLLSSLPGAAVTSIKITGAEHEFSTIPYVHEDVIEIILNLKKLRFKLFVDGPVKISLKAKGEKEVKAGDIKATSDIEIVNKDAHIATLTDKRAKLEMEIQVEQGLGYFPVEAREKEKLEIGNIAVDAIFSPIRKINYDVENIRVGQRTDFNKLILQIETDGSVTPEEALIKAAEVLVNHFTPLSRVKKPAPAAKEEKKPSAAKALKGKKEKEVESTELSIADLKLSKRTINALTENKIKTVSGLIRKKEDDIEKMAGLGSQGLKEIKKALKKLDLSLKE